MNACTFAFIRPLYLNAFPKWFSHFEEKKLIPRSILASVPPGVGKDIQHLYLEIPWSKFVERMMACECGVDKSGICAVMIGTRKYTKKNFLRR